MTQESQNTSMSKQDNPDENQNHLHRLVADSPMSTIQVIVVVMCFILNMIDGMDILVVSFTATKLETEWGLSKTELGYIFSVGLIGMMIGCLLLAPIADKIGRAKMIIFSMSLVAISMLTTAVIDSYGLMLILRLMTGIGIGCLLPTMAAMATEFSNDKRRDFNVAFFQAGWPIGAILTGLFVSWVVPLYGWRAAYLTAGCFSLAMIPLIYFFMPESLEFLAKKQPKNALKMINILLKSMGHAALEILPEKPNKKTASIQVTALFSNNLKLSTLLLWSGVFFSFMTLYTLISWIPNIATTTGMPFELATYAGTVLNLGAFAGTIGIGYLAAHMGLNRLIFLYMTGGFILMSLYANLNMGYFIMFLLILLIGFTVQGGMTGFYPAAARVYPLNIRTTGIGWAMGIGRTGAIAGPALFGIIFDAGVSIQMLFIIFSVPLFIAGINAFLIPSSFFKNN